MRQSEQRLTIRGGFRGCRPYFCRDMAPDCVWVLRCCCFSSLKVFAHPPTENFWIHPNIVINFYFYIFSNLKAIWRFFKLEIHDYVWWCSFHAKTILSHILPKSILYVDPKSESKSKSLIKLKRTMNKDFLTKRKMLMTLCHVQKWVYFTWKYNW